MPELVRCDACKTVGARPLTYTCPPDWFYASIFIEDNKTEVIIYACSTACKAALWKAGPGPHIPEAEKLVADLQRAAAIANGTPVPPTAPVVPAGALVDMGGGAIGRVVPLVARKCLFSEGTCKAGDCPEHGLFPRGDG